MFDRINNGNAFADWIIDNGLHQQGYFFDDYAKFLPRGLGDDCFVEDFHYRMSERGFEVNC